MKRISALKAIVTIAFVIMVITIVFGVPFTLIFAVANNMVPKGLSQNISLNHLVGAAAVVYLLLWLGSVVLMALALRSFKDALTLFEKRVFFNNGVTVSLAKTGKLFFAAAVVNVVAEIVSMLFAPGGPFVQISVSYGPTLLLAGLGLLFLVLSDVFAMAKNIKDENDLTV